MTSVKEFINCKQRRIEKVFIFVVKVLQVKILAGKEIGSNYRSDDILRHPFSFEFFNINSI